MFALKQILFPVDFSERCRGGARYLDALASRFPLKATMVHVLPPPHYEFSAMEVGGNVLTEFFAGRAAQVRQELATYLADEFSRLSVDRLLLEGDPARKIVALAHDERADLIVMPSHGYGPFRRFILGSVTAKVLHDAECPVWTGVHMEEAPSPEKIEFRHVMAALDLGPQSEKAFRWAAGFAKALGARLSLVHATPSIEGRAGEYFDPEWRDHFAKEARKRLEDVLGKEAESCEVWIEAGDAPKVVCEAAENYKADLLVIARGSAAGRFGRLRTNAYSIIRQSPCPVVSV